MRTTIRPSAGCSLTGIAPTLMTATHLAGVRIDPVDLSIGPVGYPHRVEARAHLKRREDRDVECRVDGARRVGGAARHAGGGDHGVDLVNGGAEEVDRAERGIGELVTVDVPGFELLERQRHPLIGAFDECRHVKRILQQFGREHIGGRTDHSVANGRVVFDVPAQVVGRRRAGDGEKLRVHRATRCRQLVAPRFVGSGRRSQPAVVRCRRPSCSATWSRATLRASPAEGLCLVDRRLRIRPW